MFEVWCLYAHWETCIFISLCTRLMELPISDCLFLSAQLPLMFIFYCTNTNSNFFLNSFNFLIWKYLDQSHFMVLMFGLAVMFLQHFPKWPDLLVAAAMFVMLIRLLAEAATAQVVSSCQYPGEDSYMRKTGISKPGRRLIPVSETGIWCLEAETKNGILKKTIIITKRLPCKRIHKNPLLNPLMLSFNLFFSQSFRGSAWWVFCLYKTPT